MRSRSRRVGTLVAALAGVLLCAPGLAQVNGNTGGFTTSIPIRVPSHRGLEPDLALVYSSLAGNGMVGVGWGLTGFSTIERQGADGGSPQFNGTDSFRLGGVDLHPCGASSSPGCVAGGTHFAEHEGYQRILYDGTANEWTVDSRNGNRSTYSPVFTVSGATYRWGLSSVTDTLGAVNTVTYQWWCDPGKNCYPDSVTYNGYRVKLYYRSDRPDPFTFATGDSLGETRQTLRSILVELDSGAALRAYALAYGASGSTGRWRLASVQAYGTDVAIDASGVVTGGTSLPAESFSYRNDPSAHSFTGGASWGACTNGGSLDDARGTGDFNGDGLQDVYCHDVWESGEIRVGLSTGSGFAAAEYWGTFCGGTGKVLTTGEFNGDGKTDFLCKEDNQRAWVTLSTGSSPLPPATDWTGAPYCGATEGTYFLGDFNGDGKTDLACHYGSGFDVEVRPSSGSSFGTPTVWIPGWCRNDNFPAHGENWGLSAKTILPGDFDGDGNTDLLCRGFGLPGGPWVALSNGTSAFVHDGLWGDVSCGGDDQRGLGDFNGDGKSDIYCYDNHAADATYRTHVGLSDGARFHAGEWLGPLGCHRFSLGDPNGDGLTDVWCQLVDLTSFYVALSDGKDGFSSPVLWAAGFCGDGSGAMAGDFNGDAKMDLSCAKATDIPVALSGSIAGKTDLLVSIQSSLGGTTAIEYVPGTQWSNTQVAPPALLSRVDGTGSHSTRPSTHRLSPGGPTVSRVTVSDGRGGSAVSNYAYSGGLYFEAERKWLGYRSHTQFHPKLPNETAGPYTISLFWQQNLAASGALEYRFDYDGAGRELTALQNYLTTGGNGETEPYTAKVRPERTTSTTARGPTAPAGPAPTARGGTRSSTTTPTETGRRPEITGTTTLRGTRRRPPSSSIPTRASISSTSSRGRRRTSGSVRTG